MKDKVVETKRSHEKPKPHFPKKTFFKSNSHEKKLEVKFDPNARRAYLTSLSSKKKQRRTFGLAMQKLKDRKEKLEKRKEKRKNELDQIVEAENHKTDEEGYEKGENVLVRMQETHEQGEARGSDEGIRLDDTDAIFRKCTTTTEYVDPLTQSKFGGNVIVTTTFGIMDENEDHWETLPGDCTERKSNGKQTSGVDHEQKYAGSVKKYLSALTGKLPSKKRKHIGSGGSASKHKGKHGAEGMKGMGSAKDLKIAQKTLNQARAKFGRTNHGKKTRK